MYQKNKRINGSNIDRQKISIKTVSNGSQKSQLPEFFEKKSDKNHKRSSNFGTPKPSQTKQITSRSEQEEQKVRKAESDTYHSSQREQKYTLDDEEKQKVKLKLSYYKRNEKEKQEILIEQNESMKRKIKETKQKISQKLFNPTGECQNTIKNHHKLKPFKAKIHLTRLESIFCEEIKKTSKILKILQQEQAFEKAFLMTNEKGIAIIYWPEETLSVIKILFSHFIKTDVVDNCLIIYFLENTKNTKHTLLINFDNSQRELQNWYSFFSCVKILSGFTSSMSNKWKELNIKSTHQKQQISQSPFRKPKLNLQSQKFKEDLKLKKENKIFQTPQKQKIKKETKLIGILKKAVESNQCPDIHQKHNVTINQVPKILATSEIQQTNSQQLSQMKKEEQTTSSPCQFKIMQQKKEIQKLLEMAKSNDFQHEIYWTTDAQKSSEEVKSSSRRSPSIPHLIENPKIKKRRTEYLQKTSLSQQIRRKVNTNQGWGMYRKGLQNQQSERIEKKVSFKNDREQSRRWNPSSERKQTKSEISQYYEPMLKKKKKYFDPEFKENMEQLRMIESRKQIEKMLLKKNMNQDTIQSKISKHISKDDEEDEQEQENVNSESSSENKYEEDTMLKLQQLQNGIVLWKCSSDGWRPHQKKLYISSENDFQLCYCDIQDSKNEKKIFLQDIDVIEYKNYGKGIIKHMKDKFTPDRCMTITYHVGEKKKTMEFMLSEKEPIYHFTEFYTLLTEFIKARFSD